jgi:hypothetical protein
MGLGVTFYTTYREHILQAANGAGSDTFYTTTYSEHILLRTHSIENTF